MPRLRQGGHFETITSAERTPDNMKSASMRAWVSLNKLPVRFSYPYMVCVSERTNGMIQTQRAEPDHKPGKAFKCTR